MKRTEEEEDLQPYFTHTLPCGMRIICAQCPTQVIYAGIAVDAGTRDEAEHESGMAHFTEHMCFKGTPRLSSRQVSARMESVGGDLNAYTGKEETVYYSIFLRQHLDRAIRLLADMVLHSTFPQEEMVKEAEVVAEEIESYNDQPSELIYDEFEGLVFPGHPLGRVILGNTGSLRQFRPADMQAFHRRMYRPGRMVLFVYGQADPEQVVRMVEREVDRYGIMAAIGEPSPRVAPHTDGHLPVEPVLRRKKDTHQAHVLLGAPSYAATDPRHTRMFMLSNLLGGPCMSSRLNVALREQHGLVYTVESNSSCYTDAGVWCVYFGCDQRDVARCLRLVHRELRRLTDAPLSQRALNALKRQLKGQIGVAGDNYESTAIGMAKRFLHYGTTRTTRQTFRLIDAVTADELQQTAQEVFLSARLQTLIYE
ncbi:MAG: M16 family metallopeptidase [Bacteroidaceae bacterium]